MINAKMKDLNDNIESPFEIKVSFDKLLKYYEVLAESEDEFIADRAKFLLAHQKSIPILREGFSELALFSKYEHEIELILRELFANVLTNNEIKTASVPYHNHIFNSSERFKSIVKNAGDGFQLSIKNLKENDRYRMACIIILRICYNYKVEFKRQFYYEIPNADGILRTYKILYNIDFTDIIPTERAPKITENDFNELLEAFDDIQLWKQKFPPNSYIFKGFVINNVFDVTDDTAVSDIKSSLLESNKRQETHFVKNLEKTFESMFNIKNIKVGFMIYNEEKQVFERIMGDGVYSYLLVNADVEACRTTLCENSYKALVINNDYFTITDVDKYYKFSNGQAQYKSLHDQGIKSAILAPIADNGQLLGVLEIVSRKTNELNTVNANILNDIIPYIVSSVLRAKVEEENLIESIIQQECTSIHPSVEWKFKQAAQKFLKEKRQRDNAPIFDEIVFENVYPLYGQIDVKGSSEARNEATEEDLFLQLNLANLILDDILGEQNLPIYQQLKFQANKFQSELETNFNVESEQEVHVFLKRDVEPVFEYFLHKKSLANNAIKDYFSRLDPNLKVIYFHRKNYDDTVSLINKNMSAIIDDEQVNAQKMYPHYFERFKTDGVEHNMYIGQSITKDHSFNEIYLYNLRLWQLQVMCEMESTFYQNSESYPLALHVTSMILVYNQPLSIRFRMDEKQFDVDGTYNARYEVVKKRVDKAFIKGTNERVTQIGKMTIVYSQKTDEEEYLKYIRFLQSKNVLEDQIEMLEIEDLQAVTGLKALRVSISYHSKDAENVFYTYVDLIKELSN